MQQPSPYIALSDEVQTALQAQQPVVALESTVIAHGLPYPANIEVAQAMESTIRADAAIPELSRSPVLVVCAGAKSILDLDLTLEYLETQGVPVIGWQTDDFPAFYVRHSGRPLAHRADNVDTIAAIARVQWECHLNGLIVGCPIPQQYAMDPAPLEAATDEALRLAHAQGVRGAATTPFLLAHVAKVTAGESVESTKALLINNALMSAR